jgi:predicted amidohydrolase
LKRGVILPRANDINRFQHPYGNAIMVICEDLWRAETIAAIAASDAEIVYVLAASPARDFSDEGIRLNRNGMPF